LENILRRKGMKTFKVNDYVKSDCFEGIKQITEINESDNCILDHKYCYSPYDLELACGFKYGQEIEVSNHDDFSNKGKRIFINYIKGAKRPIVCLMQGFEEELKNNKPFEVVLWEHARAIIPEYKRYKEPDKKWIGKVVKAKGYNATYVIEGFMFNGSWGIYPRNIKTGSRAKIGLKNLFENYLWPDGSPCGDLK